MSRLYLHKAFDQRWLSVLIGLTMVAGGITSAATLFTGVEILGLLLIVWFGKDALGAIDTSKLFAIDPAVGAGGVIAGAFLAFYAFIGFEDMVNVAEEAKNPRRTMPLAILIALGTSTLLYILVVVIATTLVPPSELAGSNAPLTLVFERSGVSDARILSIIGMTAAINGVIVQIIMGSRILYGLAKQGWLHSNLAKVHYKHKTPVTATLVILAIMIVSTLLLPLVSLAQLTSMLVLCIFTLVNISLIVIKRRAAVHQGYLSVPAFVPYAGTTLCGLTIAYQVYSWLQ